MTRQYEAVYIFDSALDEGTIDEHLDRFHALLKSKENPEPIKNTNHWGKRTLAYPIKGKEVGHYVVVQLATDPPLLPEFERLVPSTRTNAQRGLQIVRSVAGLATALVGMRRPDHVRENLELASTGRMPPDEAARLLGACAGRPGES